MTNLQFYTRIGITLGIGVTSIILMVIAIFHWSLLLPTASGILNGINLILILELLYRMNVPKDSNEQ